jgi:hypothetical protein
LPQLAEKLNDLGRVVGSLITDLRRWQPQPVIVEFLAGTGSTFSFKVRITEERGIAAENPSLFRRVPVSTTGFYSTGLTDTEEIDLPGWDGQRQAYKALGFLGVHDAGPDSFWEVERWR